MLDVPLVLFREADGSARALLDRCPHRNVPLSVGRCVGGEVECGYHGWRFDGAGTCVEVPGLAEDRADRAVRRVPAFPVVEQDGMVWVAPCGVAPIVGPDDPRKFTDSGIEIKPLYTEADLPQDLDLGKPGDFPYTHGPLSMSGRCGLRRSPQTMSPATNVPCVGF